MPTLISAGYFLPHPQLLPEFYRNKLPQEIGRCVSIGSADEDLRCELERRGFHAERITADVYLMRRDFSDGYLRRN